MRANSTRHFVFAAIVVSTVVSPVFAAPMTGTYVPQLLGVDTLLQNFMTGTGKDIPGGTIAIITTSTNPRLKHPA